MIKRDTNNPRRRHRRTVNTDSIHRKGHIHRNREDIRRRSSSRVRTVV